ncbi:hypothetical protein GCM10007907_09530 [Chitinimonas prasina]|uniref:EAL domain-containing protein n=1 Tax=Chitinimonas prasina TaxID=1434937 RepID=A0ABQ5YCF0_9NEIS|nr:EAL domain-containing protein [Chitinimonas prasina]GLR12163.1 hypothetical protein GCM10007907_09530 [Chitinimonas prasina]
MAEPQALRLRAPSILIVDDQPANIHILRAAVEDMGEVRFATSGAVALEMIKRQTPDLVLLDIEMPGMNGYEVFQAITRGDHAAGDISVIFVTANDPALHELTTLSLGAVDYLQKPLDIPVARARIKTHLELRVRTKQLAHAERNLSEVMHNLPGFVAQWNLEMRNVFCNDTSGAWFGIPASTMRGMHVSDVVGPSNFLALERHLSAVLHGQGSAFDFAFVGRGGVLRHGQVALVYRDDSDFGGSFMMLIADITDRRAAEDALHDEKEKYRITLNSIGDAVIATDVAGNIVFMNPIAEDLTGWTARDAMGEAIERVMPLQESSSGHVLQNPIRIALAERRAVGMALDCVLVRRYGEPTPVEDSASPIVDCAGNISGAVIVFHDVSEARAMAIKMSHLANHDPLTNLPNRLLLRDRTEQALRSAKAAGHRVGLLIVDFDHFKTINDSEGHSIGDKLLIEASRRLQLLAPPAATVSRQGGDEFVVLVPEVSEVERLTTLSEAMLSHLAMPYTVEGMQLKISTSIGVGIYPDDSPDMESLYRHAESAMYRAKQAGRNRISFFSAEIEEAIRTRHTLDQKMRQAIELDRFEVFYQPKYDTAIDTIAGVEALVRWRDEDGSLISPAQFIPLAEDNGLIIQIGRFVMRTACLQGVKWHSQGKLLRIAVNVSPIQLMQPNFIEFVRAVIAESGISNHLLELEITESVLAHDTNTILETLNALKREGVSIAIDDFGTGYSSLAYLKRFPIDVLKIDQSFVRDMLVDQLDMSIVEAITMLAKGLGLRLVAEGVETLEQAEALKALGCKIMQGYYYGRPQPAEEMSKLLGVS